MKVTPSEALIRIAREHLGVETLDTRNQDSLDFYSISVWQLRKALERAFLAGMESVAETTLPDDALERFKAVISNVAQKAIVTADKLRKNGTIKD